LKESLRLRVVEEPGFELTEDRRVLVHRELELGTLWIAACKGLFDQLPGELRERDGGRRGRRDVDGAAVHLRPLGGTIGDLVDLVDLNRDGTSAA
jgi:hypothetical protein